MKPHVRGEALRKSREGLGIRKPLHRIGAIPLPVR